MIANREQPLPQRDETAGDSFSDAMRELRNRPREIWLELARHDQSDRWRNGVGVAAEEYFVRLPELRADTEESLVLICGEAQLRGETGAEANLAEYQQRFPELTDDLAIQFDVNKLFHNADAASWLEGNADPADAAASQSDELPGYALLEEIGRGASGVVYRARQKSLNRLVAIKVLENPGGDGHRAARQQQEAEILARLTHPNVVRVYEVLNHRGRVHLVMELVAGPTLRDRTGGRPLDSHSAAALVQTLADTVHAVHEAGILHRDLKPSNVLLTSDSQPKISDFGLAKLQIDDNFLTTNDAILGTPSYMSPEQATGDVAKIGPATDVYSLGAILYELLTGRPPFLGVTILDTLSLIREREPVAPRQLQPTTPRDLETICLKCLQKIPDERYNSGRELANDLRRFLAGESILARPPAPVERLARFIRRKPALSAAAILLAALLAVIGLSAYRMHEQQQQLSAAALVEALATADTQTLPRLLERTSVDADRILPLIDAQLAEVSSFDGQWLNLSIAECAVDPNAAGGQLLVYLPEARPGEIASIVNVLANRGPAVSEVTWQKLVDNSSSDDERLRLACLAAKVSPADPRWREVATPVARALVHQHPLDIAAFTNALVPARQTLTPAIVELIGSGRLEPASRRSALSIVARYATEQADTLVELAVAAEPDEFALIFPALQRQADDAIPLLRSIADSEVRIEELSNQAGRKTAHEAERAYDRAQSRRATAAVALWRLEDTKAVVSALPRGDDPALRAWLIEKIGPLGIAPTTILAANSAASDPGTRQALILALGQLPVDQMSAATRRLLIDAASELYAQDPDAGVHAASRWLLAVRLRAVDVVARLDKELAPANLSSQAWQRGPNRHIFSVIRVPQSFRTGSQSAELWREKDEEALPNPRPRTIAVSMHETTVEQYQEFRPWVGDLYYSPQPDCPINNVTWFDAASYCRWLSERDNIADDQMVYPPANQIKPGMQLPANWQDRSGYRLPSEVECEFACRGGTTTPRYCGSGTALLRHYAWYLNFSDDRAWPVGQLKPNDFGLFDTLGNVAERCHQQGRYPTNAQLSGVDATPPASDLIITESQGTARGAEFADVAQNVRAARIYGVPANAEWGTVGFRVVRTISAAP